MQVLEAPLLSQSILSGCIARTLLCEMSPAEKLLALPSCWPSVLRRAGCLVSPAAVGQFTSCAAALLGEDKGLLAALSSSRSSASTCACSLSIGTLAPHNGHSGNLQCSETRAAVFVAAEADVCCRP